MKVSPRILPCMRPMISIESSRACVHDHFEEGDRGDADVFEVVGVFLPGPFFIYGFLLRFVIRIEGIAMEVHQFDRVLHF